MSQILSIYVTYNSTSQDIGYPGDIGYQSLLYPSEADLRRIFMFLIEKLPRDSSPVSDEPLSKWWTVLGVNGALVLVSHYYRFNFG